MTRRPLLPPGLFDPGSRRSDASETNIQGSRAALAGSARAGRQREHMQAQRRAYGASTCIAISAGTTIAMIASPAINPDASGIASLSALALSTLFHHE